MRVVGAVVIALLGACGFAPSAGNPDGGMLHDGSAVGSDATQITGPYCYGKGLLSVCFDDMLAAPFVAPPSGVLSTDADVNCTRVLTQPSGRELCVVAAPSIDLATNLRASGGRPLVLLAATTLTLGSSFTIDVASRDGSNVGAGGNDPACGIIGTPDNDSGGGGGAAGGSFIGMGGDGGEGDDNGANSPDGVASPSTATPAVTTTIVRGGCRGGVAGGASPNTMGKQGGAGGGAIYLIAGSVLTINGTIDAGGAGGQATSNEQGGPGGGSGGMIGLDAPTITIAGTGGAFANGGGGGEGGSLNGLGGGGMAGQNGQRSAIAAAGGNHTFLNMMGNDQESEGGHGGDGSVGTTRTGTTGQTDLGGGGGGGGGAGFIYTFGTLANNGVFSPS